MANETRLRSDELTESGRGSGFWTEGPSRLATALEKAEAEEVKSLEAEMEQAGVLRRTELEQEISEVRAKYEEQRRQAMGSFF